MAELTHIEDGKAAVFKREGTFHARFRIDGKYVYRSLKTGHLETAKKAALKLLHHLEFSVENGLPIYERSFGAVIDEYVRFYKLETVAGRKSANMLRQIERVVRFWRAYAGEKNISSIGDPELEDFIQWRRDYYTQRPTEAKRRNVKLHPTDKTLQFDMMVGKAIIRWAHRRGYRGKLPLPTVTFTPKKIRVRPAFEVGDERRLRVTLERWVKECDTPAYRATRELLLDYAMILSYSGMRVGEANKLRVRDVVEFADHEGRINYRFVVRGKTGERDVIPFASIREHVARVLRRKGDRPAPDDWFFTMPKGGQVISLADQFAQVLSFGHIRRNSHGEAFSLYSLRHYYAVYALRHDIGIYDIARNMGTSVEIIQKYYGKQATPISMATKLGGRVKAKHQLKEGTE